MKDGKSKCALRTIVRFLDDTYPEIGTDCPFFAIQVVVLSAAVLQKIAVRHLSDFTGCTRNFVEAIAQNMQNNGLWVGGKYDCAIWLVNGIITDDDRFCEETMAGEGSFWFPCADTSKTADIYRFLWEQECVWLWNSLIDDSHRRLSSRITM